MKHVIGFVLAIVTAAALLLGGGWGVAKMTALSQHGQALTSLSGLVALSAVAGVGLLVGILMAVPVISPLASGLPGLAFVGWSAWFALSAHRAVAWIPLGGSTIGQGLHEMLGDGLLALAGIAMIVPFFVPSRWRGGADDDEDEDDESPSLPAAKGLLS